MIFEYLPTHIQQDIERLRLVCAALPLRYILIPANPVSKPYPDSLSCAAILRAELWRDESYRHIQFIPTLKTSNHTSESLHSFFLSLQYLDIKHVAIISGDTAEGLLHTNDALQMLQNLSQSTSFFQQLQVFCALGSNISARNSLNFYTKIQHGIRHFITQPFYLATPQIYNKKNRESVKMGKNYPMQSKTPPTFSPIMTDSQSFLQFYHTLAALAQSSTLPYRSPTRQITIFCGFLPLTHEEQAHRIHAKQLGICVPDDYIQSIRTNATRTNIELFAQLRHHPISLSYIHFEVIYALLKHLDSP